MISLALRSAAFSTPEITTVFRVVCLIVAFEGAVVGVGVGVAVGVGVGAAPFTVTVKVFFAVAPA